MTKRNATGTDIANVTLTVAKFNPIKTTGLYTDCTVRLDSPSGRVKLSGPKVLEVTNLAKGPVVFTIQVQPPGLYFPVGIAFAPKSSAKRPRKLSLGAVRANFPAHNVCIEGGVLIFIDGCDSGTANASFEFYVLIQSSGGDGSLGIIDPGIQHDT